MTEANLNKANLNKANLNNANAIDVSVILPTYNERDNICDLIDAIQRELEPTHLSYEMLVMDDSSPDGTAATVRKRYGLHESDAHNAMGSITECGLVRVHVRTHDRGLAQSIRDGLERADGAILVVMDTDFNHDPAMIPQMVDLLRYYELIIGSRYVMRGGMEDATRHKLSMFYNLFIRLLLDTQIHDNLSGYFAVRRTRLLELSPKFDKIFYGYGDYFIRLLLLAWRNDWTILEVPVFYILRRHGDSKTGWGSVFRRYTAAVIRLRLFEL